ncbi:MAG: hypothetical protein IT530_17965 [Burkholderiales bacterium]|nr:hypothetical protein [Burkholderiales bacterium]
MTRLVSTATMVEQLEGLLGTNDLNDWETGFVESLVEARDDGRLLNLSGKQGEALDRLYRKHFA